MNQFDCLENQLREWKPRSPSPELKNRIFGHTEPADQAVPFLFGDVWRWLIPVMGCFVLLMASVAPHTSRSIGFASVTNNLLLPSITEPPVAFLASQAEHSGQNNVPHTTLEWTFGSQGGSVPQALSFYTNQPTQ